ncbi:hypothetical protein CSPX01_10746 [Colletotrichum filicis]|nr:hypothetical protein CSPX01_10746 [Colletotrichum filicis]
MDAAIDLNNMNAANTTDVLSQHVQEEGHGGPTRPFELIARTDWMRLMYHTTSQRGPTPPSREYLLPRVDNIDEFMEWRESFVQRTIYFDNWFLQFIYSIFDFFRLQYRILVTHWSEYSRWEKERIKNPWGNWEAVPTSDIETGVICGSSCSVLVPTSISAFKMRLRIYCITSLFVLNVGVQIDHLSRTASISASTPAFYSTTATPYGFHICFCGGRIRQKCQMLFSDTLLPIWPDIVV